MAVCIGNEFSLVEKKVTWPEENINVVAVCKWCRNKGNRNPFATGSTTLKASAFTRHKTKMLNTYLLQCENM